MLLRRTWIPLLFTGLFTSLFLALYFFKVENNDLSTIFKNPPFKPPAILSIENGKFNSLLFSYLMGTVSRFLYF